MPTLVGREPLGGESDLGCHPKLELVVGSLEEGEELSDHDSDVGLVREGVAELERSSSDRDVAVAKAVEDNGAMALDSIGVYADDLVESVESDVSAKVVRMTRVSGRRERERQTGREDATDRMLLSLLPKNFPRMLMAITRSPLSASISRTARTVS